jgi:hypothetical protein
VEHPGKSRKTCRQREKSREIRKTPRLCKAHPEKMLNAPSVQNMPGKLRKKHAGSKHGRWCKTRPEKMQNAPSVQNTPGKCVKSTTVQNTPGKT